MTVEPNKNTRERIENALRAFENSDAAAAASTYAENGVFIDPHYPASEYQGREAIREAFEWALTNIVEQPGFSVRNSIGAGDTYAIEVDTHHVAKDGSKREFPQVFVVEGDETGITRWRTYLPFPPDE
ncbi:nuclear transport factor 2 family protein [Halostella sp. JP-L12]|uniref:nuclear transport factor 2 family protein n=1 Tax=Halostella TaxID=1843185 RepID=UPI000EF7CF3B|nr:MULTISPECIES: nuclear transport factor 2 family protein [Halostella]NHN46582.1 nuclear transport factor 2 family protein [Halostella sp. JP-L12]